MNIVAKRVGGYPPSLSETGVYFDLAVHDLDIILYLLNEEPEKVTTHKLSIFNSKVDDAILLVTLLFLNRFSKLVFL